MKAFTGSSQFEKGAVTFCCLFKYENSKSDFRLIMSATKNLNKNKGVGGRESQSVAQLNQLSLDEKSKDRKRAKQHAVLATSPRTTETSEHRDSFSGRF